MLLSIPASKLQSFPSLIDLALKGYKAAIDKYLLFANKSSDFSFEAFWEEDCCASVVASLDCFSQSQVALLGLALKIISQPQ